jgi:SPP1 gp7 family putative phage head morphogenesis protein
MTVTLEPLTMEAAAAFWKDKVLLGPGDFARLEDEAKIRGFAVSGIAKGDELTSVYNSLQSAIKDGISYGEFKKQCAEIFTRRGWTGKREWRVQNIFRTNIQTAYNAGRWKKQTELAESFPLLQYNAVNDRRTRPTHKAMDGKVFPIGHPFWDIWYPPNGFRCRCSTLSLTEAQAKRMGLQVETEDPTNRTVAIPNPVTGEALHVKQLLPDPGFGHNPGKLAWGGIGEWQDRGRFSPLGNLPGPAKYRRPALGSVRPAELSGPDTSGLLPAGKDDLFYKEAFIEHYGEEQVLKDAAGEPVVLSLRSFLADQTPGAAESWKFAKPGQGESIPLLKGMVEKPYEIWLTPQQDSETGRVRLAKRYVALWATKDKTRVAGLMVFEMIEGVFREVTAFIPMNGTGDIDLSFAERQRQGLLLYPKR